MTRALWRQGVALLLGATLVVLPGCLTTMLWRDYPPMVRVEGSDGETYWEPGRVSFGETAARVMATPFALALDVIGFVGYVWFLDRIHAGFHRHNRHCSH